MPDWTICSFHIRHAFISLIKIQKCLAEIKTIVVAVKVMSLTVNITRIFLKCYIIQYFLLISTSTISKSGISYYSYYSIFYCLFSTEEDPIGSKHLEINWILCYDTIKILINLVSWTSIIIAKLITTKLGFAWVWRSKLTWEPSSALMASLPALLATIILLWQQIPLQ